MNLPAHAPAPTLHPAVAEALRSYHPLPRADQAVLDLERLVEIDACRRLPWWRSQGLAKPVEAPETDGPQAWPAFPPGWREPGTTRSWVRTWLDLPPEFPLRARADWVIEAAGRRHIVLLGAPTPSLIKRARLLAALALAKGKALPGLWCQPLPQGGWPGCWLGDWPRAHLLGAAPLTPFALLGRMRRLQDDLTSPLPPRRTAPRGRCWDCPANHLCGDPE